MSPVLLREWRVRLHTVANEATGGVRIHRQEERNKQVVRVPKRLVALLSYLGVRCGVHQHHAQQHNMSSDPSGLSIVDLYCRLFPNLRALHVEEVHVMCGRVNDCPEEHAISYLSMEPLTFIQG